MHHGATAADSTGCVQIELTSSGQVSDLRLSARWRERLGTDRLAEALTEAWFEAATHRQIQLLPAERRTSLASEVLDSGQDTLQHASERCRQALIEAAKRMDRHRAASALGYTGADRRQHITVTLMLDAAPVSITVNDSWLASVSTECLVGTIQEAFDAAHRTVLAARIGVEHASMTTGPQHTNGESS